MNFHSFYDINKLLYAIVLLIYYHEITRSIGNRFDGLEFSNHFSVRILEQMNVYNRSEFIVVVYFE